MIISQKVYFCRYEKEHFHFLHLYAIGINCKRGALCT